MSAAEIVWNRQPIDAQRVALVIRDAEMRGHVDLCWDDGRPFLIGIRTMRMPGNEVGLEAWKLQAELARLPIRDERRPDPFADPSADRAARCLAHQLESHARERQAKRRALPADDLDLFNPNRREARDLFSPET
jgi:hypothetical protein